MPRPNAIHSRSLRHNSAANRLTRAAIPVCEHLEDRRLMFAYTVDGSDLADTIRVDMTNGYIRTKVSGHFPVLYLDATQLIINAKAGKDIIRIDSAVAIAILINGGDGNDTIYPGSGNQIIRGGNGTDIVDFSAFASNLHITLEDLPNDSTGTGASDSISTDVEAVIGGKGNDLIDATGMTTPITLKGGPGNDTLIGGNANDLLDGGPGVNSLDGVGGKNRISNWGPTAPTSAASSTRKGAKAPKAPKQTAPVIYAERGVLYARAASTGSKITVSARGSTHYLVNINGITWDFLSDNINTIMLVGGPANDRLVFSTKAGPIAANMTANGGGGRNYVYIPAAHDNDPASNDISITPTTPPPANPPPANPPPADPPPTDPPPVAPPPADPPPVAPPPADPPPVAPPPADPPPANPPPTDPPPVAPPPADPPPANPPPADPPPVAPPPADPPPANPPPSDPPPTNPPPADPPPTTPQQPSAPEPKPFLMYDNTYFLDKPDLAPFGMQQIMVVAGSFFWKLDDPRGGYDWTKPNEAATRQVARRAANANQTLVIDIEHMPEDIRVASLTSVQATIQTYIQIINWLRSERPDVKLGFYGSFPLRDYWTPVNYWQAMDHRGEAWFESNLPRFAEKYRVWQAANDVFKSLADKVDYLFPSLFTFYNDPAGWAYYAKGNILEAKRFGKPVIPFIWMDFHDSTPLIGQRISAEFWRLQLDTLGQLADSLVIWGGVHSSPDAPPVPEQWNAADPWWIQTKNFIADLLTRP